MANPTKSSTLDQLAKVVLGSTAGSPFNTNTDVLAAAPGAVQAIATGNTITVAGPGVSAIRLSAGAAATGVILAPGSVDQQEITLYNESANSITFAAVGTSNVANGAGAVLASLTAMRLQWNAQAATPAWYVI